MTDTSNAIGIAPVVQILAPYAVAVVGVVLTWIIKEAVSAFTHWTGIKVDQEFEQQFEAAAATEAGKLVAGAADNLATREIDVTSPFVQDAAKRLMNAEHLQDAIKWMRMTPERAAAIVTGELGKLQALMGAPQPAPKA